MAHQSFARRFLVAVVVLCAASTLASCTGSPKMSSGDNQGFVSGDGSTVVVAAKERDAAPDLSGTTLQGDTLSLSDYKGDVVILNVWASWCGPCRAEGKTLQSLADKYANQGVQFVGVNTRDEVSNAEAFNRNFDIQYPSLSDPDGQLQLLFADTIPPSQIPSTLVLDREGRIAARVLGPVTYAQLDGLIDDVVTESKSS